MLSSIWDSRWLSVNPVTPVTLLLNRVFFFTFLSFITLIITIYKVSSETFTYEEKKCTIKLKCQCKQLYQHYTIRPAKIINTCFSRSTVLCWLYYKLVAGSSIHICSKLPAVYERHQRLSLGDQSISWLYLPILKRMLKPA